jgi:stage III sporulation protein SpoIIIAA
VHRREECTAELAVTTGRKATISHIRHVCNSQVRTTLYIQREVGRFIIYVPDFKGSCAMATEPRTKKTLRDIITMLFQIKQEVMGTANRLICFETTRTAQKTKKGGIDRSGTQRKKNL